MALEVPVERNSAWYAVIRSKLNMDYKKMAGIQSRNPWKDISHGINSFTACCRFFYCGEWETKVLGRVMGRGESLLLLLKCVSTLVFPISWDFGFRTNLNNLEVKELLALLYQILRVVLIPSR